MIRKLFLIISLLLAAGIFWYKTNNSIPEELVKITSNRFLIEKSAEETTPPENAPSDIKYEAIKEELVLPRLPKLIQQELAEVAIPGQVKALYVTAQRALSPFFMNAIIKVVEETGINSLVINVKDGSSIFLGKSMAEVVSQLRSAGIYPIARLVVFQDNYLAEKRKDLALTADDSSLWGKNGYNWVDPASEEVWDFNVDTALRALEMGFMEINLDYIRFPDGDVQTINYPVYNGEQLLTTVINNFSDYFVKKVKEKYPNAIISADIFAYSLLRTHGLGVGQQFTALVDYYDVISPMIYPSHYGAGNFGFENPAEYPYEVVFQTLESGNQQLRLTEKTAVIRPWIQDFDLGAVYNTEKVKAEVQAVYDALKVCEKEGWACAGIAGGWMSWSPNNFYDIEKYKVVSDLFSATQNKDQSIKLQNTTTTPMAPSTTSTAKTAE